MRWLAMALAVGVAGCASPMPVAATDPASIRIRYNDSMVSTREVEARAGAYCAGQGLAPRFARRANVGAFAFPEDRYDCVPPPPPPG